MQTPIVIGIAGGTGSGKSTVLDQLLRRFGTAVVAVLEHDMYYYDLGEAPLAERTRFNFDHPDALDTPLLRAHLDRLIAGQPIDKPVYDFASHRRLATTTTVFPRPVILVEGILVLAEPLLRERMDVKLFVDTADDIRLTRRLRRDLVDRGRDVESVLHQYVHTVRPMHLQFVEPSRQHADLIIPRGGHNQVAIDVVMAYIAACLASPSLVES
jgi:uridine kinase